MLTCQRMGCNAKYRESENSDGRCRHHPGPPLFHDGGKQWSCCKARSHDFATFMDIEGCTLGRHTQEKPPKPAEAAPPPPAAAPMKLDPLDPRLACGRCKQGFFCADHAVVPAGGASEPEVEEVDPDAMQTCRRQGCGQKFTERANTDTACSFHPGPPVFHDRNKGWACCDVHVKDFDEFVAIPPCATGRHRARLD